MKNSRFAILVIALAAIAAGPVAAGECGSGEKDIVATAVGAGQFKTLATALTKAGLVGALQGEGPFTVFAPTDDAFAKLPEGTVAKLIQPENKEMLTSILTYHVVKGRVPASAVVKLKGARTLNGQRVGIVANKYGVKVDNAKVIKADIECSNGIIHVIDNVILPQSKDIVDVASGAGKFKTLLAAAQAAGLVDVLKSKGPLTVFAPTDDAFAKLPAGTVEMLLKPENKSKLAQILTYHVVAGRVFSEDALKAGRADTVAKMPLMIRVRDGKAFVQDSQLIATDINASNGVIHIIDSVLLPPTAGG